MNEIKLCNNSKIKNSKIQYEIQNKEKYILYLEDLINQNDHLLINYTDNSFNKIPCTKYEKIIDCYSQPMENINTIYNIENHKNIVIDYIRSHIENAKQNELIFLVEGNKINVIANIANHKIYDYRDKNVIENSNNELSKYNYQVKSLILSGESYTVYKINNLFEDLNEEKYYGEVLSKACRIKNSPEEFEFYLDHYHKYLLDLIDEANYFFIDEMMGEEGITDIYKELFKYSKYDEIRNKNNDYNYNSNYVYDITSNMDKDKFKKIFKFNIEDEHDEYIEYVVNKEYFDNSGKYYFKTYLINDKNNIIAIIETFNGAIFDYRPEKKIKAHQENYKKITNKK